MQIWTMHLLPSTPPRQTVAHSLPVLLHTDTGMMENGAGGKSQPTTAARKQGAPRWISLKDNCQQPLWALTHEPQLSLCSHGWWECFNMFQCIAVLVGFVAGLLLIGALGLMSIVSGELCTSSWYSRPREGCLHGKPFPVATGIFTCQEKQNSIIQLRRGVKTQFTVLASSLFLEALVAWL